MADRWADALELIRRLIAEPSDIAANAGLLENQLETAEGDDPVADALHELHFDLAHYTEIPPIFAEGGLPGREQIVERMRLTLERIEAAGDQT